MNVEDLSPEETERLVSLLKEKEMRRIFNKIDWFEPYEWQMSLANATDLHKQLLAMCANQIGKSTAGAYITACHLTGRYPKWWKGHKFKKPIYSWASGVSNDTTRDIIQTELLGLAEDPEALGTGMIPKDCIVETTRRRGATGNTYDSILVKHYDPDTGKYNGNSRIGFKSYEMGEEKFYGRPVDWIWLDEQPPSNIYTQCITRTVATQGLVMMTFTPEDGVTPVVHQFMHDRQDGQYLLQASWDDAPHLDEATKLQLLAQYPPHERELRSKGIPVFGSGLVFPFSQDDIAIEPFDLPDNWPRIAAIDFGWDHPTAVVWCAVDPASDTVYIYDAYTERKATPIVHSAAINARPRWIPVAWPKDGLQTDKGSGLNLAEQYRNLGVNMLHDFFRNPSTPGDKGKGNVNIEPGIMEIIQRIETNRFKVFSHLNDWFQEYSAYHRKDGKIVPIKDDLMSATRYAVQSIRFAEAGSNTDYSFSSGSLPINEYSYV
jgi:phage terminase large subunit-like protein